MIKQLPEQFRHGKAFSDDGTGMFYLPRMGKKQGSYFLCLITNGLGWEHVSVSIPSERRCPTWEEMCYIKDMFFDKDEVVVQFHPAEKDYVNNHPHCLHLWRYLDGKFPTPDPLMVGIKTT